MSVVRCCARRPGAPVELRPGPELDRRREGEHDDPELLHGEERRREEAEQHQPGTDREAHAQFHVQPAWLASARVEHGVDGSAIPGFVAAASRTS